jgi:hypothetical protein
MSHIRLLHDDISFSGKGWYELKLSNSDITIHVCNFLTGINENEDLLDFCLFNNIQGNIEIEDPTEFVNNLKNTQCGKYESFIDYDMVHQAHYGVNIEINNKLIKINQIEIKYDEILIQDIINFFELVLLKWHDRINNFALKIVQNGDFDMIQQYYDIFEELYNSDFVSNEFIEEYSMFI